jgi:hypothetical protein
LLGLDAGAMLVDDRRAVAPRGEPIADDVGGAGAGDMVGDCMADLNGRWKDLAYRQARIGDLVANLSGSMPAAAPSFSLSAAGIRLVDDRRADLEGGQVLQMKGGPGDLAADLGRYRRRSPGRVLGPVGAS